MAQENVLQPHTLDARQVDKLASSILTSLRPHLACIVIGGGDMKSLAHLHIVELLQQAFVQGRKGYAVFDGQSTHSPPPAPALFIRHPKSNSPHFCAQLLRLRVNRISLVLAFDERSCAQANAIWSGPAQSLLRSPEHWQRLKTEDVDHILAQPLQSQRSLEKEPVSVTLQGSAREELRRIEWFSEEQLRRHLDKIVRYTIAQGRRQHIVTQADTSSVIARLNEVRIPQ